jgi:hypothetical protein
MSLDLIRGFRALALQFDDLARRHEPGSPEAIVFGGLGTAYLGAASAMDAAERAECSGEPKGPSAPPSKPSGRPRR